MDGGIAALRELDGMAEQRNGLEELYAATADRRVGRMKAVGVAWCLNDLGEKCAVVGRNVQEEAREAERMLRGPGATGAASFVSMAAEVNGRNRQ
ncbi:hypothetical protein DFP98_1117 [Cohnella phaseoli]|uniref:Uncharacterized protein n=2 Tax=Cohnella phaseoli TaxID=456490 RepID=A0A3D9JR77_9BACL|nr:hypothetical protein DFP98_1117 [Cohnella phaseoli]